MTVKFVVISVTIYKYNMFIFFRVFSYANAETIISKEKRRKNIKNMRVLLVLKINVFSFFICKHIL